MIAIGTKVPEFELKDQHGQSVSRVDLRDKRVVLSFHPLAWTEACQRPMEALELNVSAFEGVHAGALGVSVDSSPCKKAWAESIHVMNTSLLVDYWPYGRLAKALGILREDIGFSERARVILDTHGVVQWIKDYPVGESPDLQEVLHVLKNLDS